MTATILPNGKQQFIDINGAPLVGGTVGFYVPNTLVPKNTWQDSGETILNTNPIVLDSRGQAIIYGDGTYRQIVKDALGNVIWDQLTTSTPGNNSWLAVNILQVYNWISGAIDSTYRSFMGLVNSSIRPNPGFSTFSQHLGGVAGGLSAGSYSVTAPNIMLSSSDFPVATMGFDLQGAGRSITQLLYAPISSGPMFNNNDHLAYWRIRDMEINGADAGSDLLDSYASGTTQTTTFDNIVVTGVWNYVVNLTGTNLNSEMSFYRSDFLGSANAFLYIGASNTSDGFLNYWFTNFKDWSLASPLVDIAMGGHVKFINVDHSGFAPGQQTYKTNLRGVFHGEGAPYFVENGGRYELVSQQAGALYGEWGTGTILFEGTDTSAQSFRSYAYLITPSYFKLHNFFGAKFIWKSSDVIGHPVFEYANNDGYTDKNIVYEDVDFNSANGSIASAFSFVATGGHSNLGAIPTIHINRARIRNTLFNPVLPPNTFAPTLYFNSMDLNWRKTQGGYSSVKACSWKNFNSYMPPDPSVVTDASFTGVLAPKTASFTASITGDRMTVTAVSAGVLIMGSPISGAAAGTTIGLQASGTPGGTGVYQVTPQQTLGSSALTATYGQLTASAVTGTIARADQISGAGVAANSVINMFGTGTGGAGTYYTPISQTVGSESMVTGVPEWPLVVFDAGQIVTDVIIMLPANANTSNVSVTPELLDAAGNVVWTGTAINPYSNGAAAYSKRYALTAPIDLGSVAGHALQPIMSGANQRSLGDFIVLIAG